MQVRHYAPKKGLRKAELSVNDFRQLLVDVHA